MPSSREIKAGAAYVELFLQDNRYRRGLNLAAKRLKAFGKQVGSIGKRMTAMGVGVFALGFAAANSFAKMGDQLHKMNLRTRMSVESLSQLAYAAELSDTTIEGLGAALFRAQRRIANATSGTGPAVRALEELGLVAEDLIKLSPEKQFFALVDALAAVDNEARATQMAFEIFGDNARDLWPLLSQGTAEIKRLMKEGDRLGYTMSQKDADAAAEFSDVMTTLGRTVKLVAIHIGQALAGPLGEFAQWITEKAVELAKLVKKHEGWAVSILKLAAAAAVLGPALVVLSHAITALAISLTAVGFAVGVLATPFGAALFAVVALAAGIAKVTGRLDEMIEGLGHWTNELSTGIVEALAAGDVERAFELLSLNVQMIWQQMLMVLQLKWQEVQLQIAREMDRMGNSMLLSPATAVAGLAFKAAGKLAGRGAARRWARARGSESLDALRKERAALMHRPGKDGETGGLDDDLPATEEENFRHIAQRLQRAMAHAGHITRGTFSGEAARRMGGPQAWQTGITQTAQNTKAIAADVHRMLGEIQHGGMLVGAS